MNDKLSLWAARSVERLRRLVKRRNPLVHLCAGGDGGVELDQVETLLTILLVDSADEHAAAGNAHHLARRQVGDGEQGLANQVLGLVISVNTGEDGAVGAGAVVERKVQQLLGLLDGLACLDLHSAEIALGEGIKVDELLKQRLNGDLGVIERGLKRLNERACSVAGLGSLGGSGTGLETLLGLHVRGTAARRG